MSTTEEIWNVYHSSLLSFVRKRVSDESIAEDILQDIFIKIHMSIDSLADKTKLESWLYQITRNAVIDYYRVRAPVEELPDWLVQEEAESGELVRQELSTCLIPMIKELPEKYRLAVRLSEIEGKTQKEVAEQEGISLSGAKSRIQRGRGLLKAMLHECCELEVNNNQVVEYDHRDKGCKNC